MKKIILSILVLTSVTLSTQAQTRRDATPKTENNEVNGSVSHKKHNGKSAHHEMLKSLNLNKTQRQQMKSLNADFKSKMSELKNKNLSDEELKTNKKALFIERKQKMEAFLTPEQKIKMEQYHKQSHKNKEEKEAEGMDKRNG